MLTIRDYLNVALWTALIAVVMLAPCVAWIATWVHFSAQLAR